MSKESATNKGHWVVGSKGRMDALGWNFLSNESACETNPTQSKPVKGTKGIPKEWAFCMHRMVLSCKARLLEERDAPLCVSPRHEDATRQIRHFCVTKQQCKSTTITLV
eukprot:scaffold2292_cov301-Pavlova_lutheri.AAC.15